MLPPVLATATSLTALSLSHNTRLALAPADVRVLLRLPRLRQLALDGTATPAAVLAELDRGSPWLVPGLSPGEASWIEGEGNDAERFEADGSEVESILFESDSVKGWHATFVGSGEDWP